MQPPLSSRRLVLRIVALALLAATAALIGTAGAAASTGASAGAKRHHAHGQHRSGRRHRRGSHHRGHRRHHKRRRRRTKVKGVAVGPVGSPAPGLAGPVAPSPLAATPSGSPESSGSSQPTNPNSSSEREKSGRPAEKSGSTEIGGATSEETKPPAEETKRPPEEKKPPAEETKAPSEEKKPPAEETESPAEETKPPSEETKPPAEETKPPSESPSHTPPPSPACTQTFSSVSAAASALDSASATSAICLSAGDYGHLSLSGTHAGEVTIEPVPGAAVHVEGVTVAAGASYITIHDFGIGGGVSLGAGDSHIVVDHNDIDGEEPGGDGEGVETLSVNCTAPNAPTYSGCTSTTPDSYITINGNEIHGYGQGNTEDAIHLNDWEHVTITDNDIYKLEEHGNHTDAMQSVFGGHYMLFERNYEHDNQSQGFFIKDGDASEVTVNDNLFLRNDNEPSLYPGGEYNIQIFNTTGLKITNNTVWDGQQDILRAENAAEALTAQVNHNVEEAINVLNEGGPTYSLSEDYDVFAEEPWTFKMGAQSKVQRSPDFADPTAEDYELASNPEGIGVNWKPSEYVYGPTGD